MSSKSIVIVGGGSAGYFATRRLTRALSSSRSDSSASRYSITLVTARPFSILIPAAARLTTTSEGRLEDTCFLPYDELFASADPQKVDTKLQIGRVVRIEQGGSSGAKKGGEVVLEDGARVRYDALVLAPGATWPGPLDFPDGEKEVLSYVETWRQKFRDAKAVVIVGGGSVGIEFAGEIKEFYPDKPVTIVHNGPQLLNSTYSARYRSRLEQDVRERGVNIVFNDRVDEVDESGNTSGEVRTRSGKTIRGDLIVPTYGSRPATSFIESLGSDVLNSSGHIKVNADLRLPKFSNIFALGDAIDWHEEKQLAKYTAHAKVVTANVVSYLDGKQLSQQYKGSPEIIIITNGKEKGVAYLSLFWGMTLILGNWFAALTKSRTLMVSIFRKYHWGLKA